MGKCVKSRRTPRRTLVIISISSKYECFSLDTCVAEICNLTTPTNDDDEREDVNVKSSEKYPSCDDVSGVIYIVFIQTVMFHFLADVNLSQ